MHDIAGVNVLAALEPVPRVRKANDDRELPYLSSLCRQHKLRLPLKRKENSFESAVSFIAMAV